LCQSGFGSTLMLTWLCLDGNFVLSLALRWC
jgi:hypothetical protein